MDAMQVIANMEVPVLLILSISMASTVIALLDIQAPNVKPSWQVKLM